MVKAEHRPYGPNSDHFGMICCYMCLLFVRFYKYLLIVVVYIYYYKVAFSIITYLLCCYQLFGFRPWKVVNTYFFNEELLSASSFSEIERVHGQLLRSTTNVPSLVSSQHSISSGRQFGLLHKLWVACRSFVRL